MSVHDMQRAGGVSETIYRDIATGRVREVLQSTARRILATRPGGKLAVPSAGAARRLQALAVNGWGVPALAAVSGLDKARLNDLRRVASATIPVADHEAIAALYNRLWDQRPAETRHVQRVRTVARQHNWAQPLAWDDDRGPHGIDNPDATPHRNGPEAKRHGEAAEEVLRLLGTDSAEGIARRLGYRSYDNLALTLSGSGNHDLARRLRQAKEVA